jgi:hypothetical protein
MSKNIANAQQSTLRPALISRFKKERFLRTLSEDDFRDKLVRPLFLRKGFKDGRELCGTKEEGKDTLFIDEDKLGMKQIWVVQTKAGNLNLSGKYSQNTTIASTQLKTALEIKITLLATKQRIYPTHAVLCASGKINENARKHICDTLQNPRIRFMDLDDIIPLIDEYYPEFWWGIDADRFPYLRSLRDILLASSDTIALSELGIDLNSAAPIADDMYVSLFLHRLTTKRVKYKGQIYQEPQLEQLPIQAVLGRKEKLIQVIGEAGTGKTTALRRIAFTIAEKALTNTDLSMIPVILRSRDIATSDRPLLQLITSTTLGYVASTKPCFTQEDLMNGNLLVLVDALDEVHSQKIKSVIERLLDFHNEFPNCRIILTSRNYSSITNMIELNIFVKFYISPINLNQAQKLLERLSRGKSLPVHQANEILRQLHQVHGLELNPLLVTVFAATSDYSRRDIPANITELFKKFTEMMIGRWDMKKGLSQQYQAVVKDFLLKRLAFYMHSNNWRAIPLSNCKTIFREELSERGYEADLDLIFDEIVYRSGLFRVEDDSLLFRHALLQEFFAGRGVPSAAFFQGVITDDRWKHPLVFYFGEHPDAHADLMNLIENVGRYDGLQLYRSAVAVGLAAQACYLSKVTDKQKSMEWLIKSLGRSKDGFLKAAEEQNPNFPLSAFLGYYIFARDSVACESITNDVFAAAEQLRAGPESPEVDVSIFWHLVSLVESGSLDKALLLLKKFKPNDLRLLLALHLGCFLIAELRVTSHEERKLAKRMCEFIGPKVSHLRQQVLGEFKSMLLEVRRGKIEALPSSKDLDSKPKSPARTSPVKGRFNY